VLPWCKQKERNLTSKEEEWLDNKGNLIEKFMLMEHLKNIKPNSQHIFISHTNVEIITKINAFQAAEIKEKSPIKSKANAPSSKKNSTNTAPLPKKKHLVKEK
jgi:hypothetical protein